jgi:chemotaxis signal transduction protein
VRRVLSGGTLTPLPCAPAHLVGLVSDRGAPLPVVCLDPWLDEPVRACRSSESVLVLECGGLRFGVVVDRVGGVGWLPSEAGDEAGEPAAVVSAARPADGGPVSLLDPTALAAAAIAAADAAFAAAEGPRAA